MLLSRKLCLFKSKNLRRISVSVSTNYDRKRLVHNSTESKQTKVRPQSSFINRIEIPFKHAQHGRFFQENFKLHNPFSEDYPLQRFLKHHLPKEALGEITSDLCIFGNRIAKEIYSIGLECDQQLPHLKTFNSWGERVDELWTCDAWKQQRKISAEEGIVAIGYERKFHQWSRLYQLAKLYLYAPAAGLYTCPLAMTDGAAKTIEVVNSQNTLFANAFKKLTSRDPNNFWTSGQWMTERKGGSDVANGTETVAIPEENVFGLYGYKWFSSATDADMALTLARIPDSSGNVKQGTKGLTLFYIETKTESGKLNNIQMVKLKNKLGTRQVPTAELLLDGALAHKMSAEGEGVSGISNMLTITRIHNATASVGAMRHMLRLSRDYSQRRLAFGNKIGNYPLHMQTLAKMEVETRGAFLLLMKVAILLGRTECGVAKDEDILLLRLLSPILKLYTAKQAVACISEGLESFGGQGYIEDTGLPIMLRDAQVLPIWEGTTNILALDVLRCISKTNGEVFKVLISNVNSILDASKSNQTLMPSHSAIEQSIKDIVSFTTNHPDQLVAAARDYAYSIARTYIAALMLENACTTDSVEEDKVAALRWCKFQDICPLTAGLKFGLYCGHEMTNDYQLVMEGYKG